MYKMIVVVRGDLKMSKGKTCAQVAHAVLDCFMKQKDRKLLKAWLDEGGKKVVLKAEGRKELSGINEAARRAGLPTSVIEDAGRTELEPGTITCMGVGPEREEKIDRVAGELPTL